MAGIDVENGHGVICNDLEKELAGKAISALRILGNNAQTKRAKSLLISRYGLTESESGRALFILLETKQASKTGDFWILDERVIQKYGYPEHRVKRSPVKSKNVVKPRPAVDEKVSVIDGMEVLEKILTVQRNNTMLYLYCRRELKSKGMGVLEIDELFVRAKKERVIVIAFGYVTWKGRGLTAEKSEDIPGGYTVRQRVAE